MIWLVLIVVFISITEGTKILRTNVQQNNSVFKFIDYKNFISSNYVEIKINLLNHTKFTNDYCWTNSSSNGILINSSISIPINFKNYTFKISLFDEIYYMRTLTTLDIISFTIKYVNNITDFHSFRNDENPSIKKTILLIEDIILLRDIQSLFYMSQGRWRKKAINNTAYSAIIFNNSSSLLNLIIQDISHPILEADNFTFNEIKKFSQYNPQDNKSIFSHKYIQTEISLKYDNTHILLPYEYLYTSCYLNIFLITITVIIWIINTFYINKRNSTIIQKILFFVLCIKFLVILLLYIYLKTITQYNLMEEDILFSKVYLETAITILSSIFRTILTYLIILLSHGWKIYLNILGRREVKTFVMIYLLIYISICIDQMLDVTFNKCGQFLASEIKNISMSLVLNIFIAKKIYHSVKFLKTKLVYAFEHTYNFVNCFRFKIQLMKNLFFIWNLYTLSYIISIIVYRKYYSTTYDVYDRFISSVNFNNIEMGVLIIFLFCFKSRKLPENYWNDMAMLDNNPKIFKKLKIEVYKTKISDDIFLCEKSLKIIKINDKSLLLLANPFYKLENKESDYMNSLCIGFPCKF